MNSDKQFWQSRYRQQVGWTADLRRHFFEQSDLPHNTRLLEVGCGSGALLETLRSDGYTNLLGIDKNLPALSLIPSDLLSACADGLTLPFIHDHFDACLCHFYLLWVKDPLSALLEMKRVTHPGGWLAALAEPDFSARFDQPNTLETLGKLQTQALINQGADPTIGKQLLALFNQIGLTNIQSCVLSQQTGVKLSQEAWEMEWTVLRADLSGLLSPTELTNFQEIDHAAWQSGTRVLYVPVHYAFGQIPAG